MKEKFTQKLSTNSILLVFKNDRLNRANIKALVSNPYLDLLLQYFLKSYKL